MLNGWDSEANRRDAIRQQIVQQAVDSVLALIGKNGPTKTQEERQWLEQSVAVRLLQGLQWEAMSQVYRQEIRQAEAKLDEPEVKSDH